MSKKRPFKLGLDYTADGEPCMFLGSIPWGDKFKSMGFIMPGRFTSSGKRAYVIPLKMAYMYAESESGGPTEFLMQRAFEIASYLGLDHERHTIMQIIDAIVENLPDLLAMPPHAGPSMKDLERKAEQQGLIIMLDGKRVLDAS